MVNLKSQTFLEATLNNINTIVRNLYDIVPTYIAIIK